MATKKKPPKEKPAPKTKPVRKSKPSAPDHAGQQAWERGEGVPCAKDESSN